MTTKKPKKAPPASPSPSPKAETSAFDKGMKECGITSRKHFATKVLVNPNRWQGCYDEAKKIMTEFNK